MTASRDAAELRYLRSPRAVRERCAIFHARAARGELEHWRLDETRLAEVAQRVVRTTAAAYADPRAIPKHSRWRHFFAGGVDRVRAFDERLLGLDEEEKLAARFDLAITSVLLDAGAGDGWRYRDSGGQMYTRSEGIAVASYDLFVAGTFSDDPAAAPLRADATALERTTAASLGRALQVDDDNPMIGVEGRAMLLRRLGRAAREASGGGGGRGASENTRIGDLGVRLRRAGRGEGVESGRGGTLPARDVLGAVLRDLGSIWPGREVCAGENLGDVWTHSALGRVPFHKLSQWLTYSLLEPLEWAGVSIVDLGELTGLAEYRNGGLFVDGGVLVPRSADALLVEHEVSSDLIIEWRALTVSLLDRTAELVRGLLGLSADDLPLTKILEGGTWRAGREIAREKRAGGGPPLRVRSDGTVF